MTRTSLTYDRQSAHGPRTTPKIRSPEYADRRQDHAAVAALYNGAGDSYSAYADGSADGLFAFDGGHSYTDQCVWNVLNEELARIAASRRKTIRILDAGCGPGTWLRRVVTRAAALGFTDIQARGFDIAEGQVRRARTWARELQNIAGVSLTFDVADLIDPLPEPDSSVDITLCLFSVLSHLSTDRLDDVVRELARVTAGSVVTTVRPTGSPPTASVRPIEDVKSVRYNHVTDVCAVELKDGQTSSCCFHLFTPSEIRACFERHLMIRTVVGLDLFHTRFKGDPRWNPPGSHASQELLRELDRLEEAYGFNAAFLTYAAHMLIIADRDMT